MRHYWLTSFCCTHPMSCDLGGAIQSNSCSKMCQVAVKEELVTVLRTYVGSSKIGGLSPRELSDHYLQFVGIVKRQQRHVYFEILLCLTCLTSNQCTDTKGSAGFVLCNWDYRSTSLRSRMKYHNQLPYKCVATEPSRSSTATGYITKMNAKYT